MHVECGNGRTAGLGEYDLAGARSVHATAFAGCAGTCMLPPGKSSQDDSFVAVPLPRDSVR